MDSILHHQGHIGWVADPGAPANAVLHAYEAAHHTINLAQVG
ncbi:hypothetical protein ABT104_05995 [Streptomyces mobaraensis]